MLLAVILTVVLQKKKKKSYSPNKDEIYIGYNIRKEEKREEVYHG